MPILASPACTQTLSHFEASLERLHEGVLRMGSAVDAAVGGAVRAFKERDVAQAQSLIADDRRIDVEEMRLDEECLKLTALYRPTGRDLRLLTGTMKIISDLERVGDLAVTIAERVRAVADLPAGETPTAVLDIADRVRSMISSTLTALVRGDARLAEWVLEMGASVDELRRDLLSRLEMGIRSTPQQVPLDLHTFMVVESLDRIAKRASHMAEDVVYLLEETILRKVS